jgi:hypothetical protein
MMKRICLRFLLLAMMLLATVVLNASPRRETCGECIANCDAWYDRCVAAGRTDCGRGRLLCYLSCSPVCNTPPEEPPTS